MPTSTLSRSTSSKGNSKGSVTLADVARRAGVNSSTVSRVLNGVPGAVPIKPQTRNIVEQAARELGYAPNAAARALANGRTNIIGVVCYDITDPLVPYLLSAVEDEAAKQGYRLFICTTRNDGPAEEASQGTAYISLLHERQVDAILVFGERIIEAKGYLADFPEVSSAMAAGITGDGLACTIDIDHFGGGIAVGEHLASLGHRQVAFLTGAHSNESVERRQNGIREGFKKSGAKLISIEAEQVSPFDQAGYQGITTLLASHPEVTAAVARNDRMALGAMRALYEARVHVPDQFSLVSWGDAYFSSLTCPSLTSVNTPIQKAGRDLIIELITILKSPTTSPAHMTLPMELIVRESTGSVRIK